MKPVERSQVAGLLETKPILLLNQMAVGRSYVHQLVHRSPGNISSKQGAKQFPLEIWHLILGFAVDSVGEFEWSLVQPHSLKQDETGQEVLVCHIVVTKEIDECSRLENGAAVAAYEWCLSHPDGPFSDEDRDGCYPLKDRPFYLPDTTKIMSLETWPEELARATNSAIEIRTAMFDSDVKFLFAEITVPDMIARVEWGWCRICDYGRWFCPCAVCLRPSARKDIEGFVRSTRGNGFWQMMCPRCMGISRSEESLRRQEHDSEPDGITEGCVKPNAEYEAWFKARRKELGSRGRGTRTIMSVEESTIGWRKEDVYAAFFQGVSDCGSKG